MNALYSLTYRASERSGEIPFATLDDVIAGACAQARVHDGSRHLELFINELRGGTGYQLLRYAVSAGPGNARAIAEQLRSRGSGALDDRPACP